MFFLCILLLFMFMFMFMFSHAPCCMLQPMLYVHGASKNKKNTLTHVHRHSSSRPENQDLIRGKFAKPPPPE